MRAFFMAGCVLLALQGTALAQGSKPTVPAQKVIPREPLPTGFRKPQPYVIPQGNSADEQERRAAIEADDADEADADEAVAAQQAQRMQDKRTPRKRNPSAVPPLNRSYQDNPDRSRQPMVHFIYAVPAGGVDYARDLGTLAPYAINSANRWLASQIRRKLRVDTYQGHLDITFVRLPNTDAYYDTFGANRLLAIEQDLHTVFAARPHKKYVVLYEGTNPAACAEAVVGGPTAVVYLHGLENSPFTPCADVPWAAGPTDAPGYHEFALLHEIVHLVGAVGTAAPHYQAIGHVGDTPDDLMYGGALQWSPAFVDVGQDDYYRRRPLPKGLFNLVDAPVLKRR